MGVDCCRWRRKKGQGQKKRSLSAIQNNNDGNLDEVGFAIPFFGRLTLQSVSPKFASHANLAEVLHTIK